MQTQELNTDILVIGGGINGCGIAADAASRGLNVILCDKGDLACQTSSKSSKLIHGGLRYLEGYHFSLVRKALKERELLLNLAPQLIQPQPFVLPHHQSHRPFALIRLGLFLYDMLAKSSLGQSQAIYRAKNKTLFAPLKELYQSGFRYFDAKTNDARLVIANALQASHFNAKILNYTEFLKGTRVDKNWVSQLKSDTQTIQVKSKLLINAAGPWVEQLNQDFFDKPPFTLSHILGSHLVTERLYQGEHAYILQHEDKRIIFVIPYLDKYSLIGTTDVDYQGDIDKAHVSDEEIDYLLALVNHYFAKALTKDDIIDQFWGIRPLIKESDTSAKNLTRDYKLHISKESPKLISVYGGKITTYRVLAKECMDLAKDIFPNLKPSMTHIIKLPGNNFESYKELVREVENDYPNIKKSLVSRFCSLYGTRVYDLLADSHTHRDLGEDHGHDLYTQEIDFLKKNEWAKTAEDILSRRTKLDLLFNFSQIESLKSQI